MINIVVSEKFEGSVDPVVLEKTALKVLEQYRRDEEIDISIAIEDNEYLQALNSQFLGNDTPTDVLSFPGEETDPDTGHFYLGDIIISLPMASIQAETAGHPVQNELQLLVVHGMLHLIGFDHDTPAMKIEMWRQQAQLLKDLSVIIKKLPED